MLFYIILKKNSSFSAAFFFVVTGKETEQKKSRASCMFSPQHPSHPYVSVTGFNYLFICLSVRLCRDASPHPLVSAATSKVRHARSAWWGWERVEVCVCWGNGGGGVSTWRSKKNKQGLAQGRTTQMSFSRRPFLVVTISHTLSCLPGRPPCAVKYLLFCFPRAQCLCVCACVPLCWSRGTPRLSAITNVCLSAKTFPPASARSH